MSTTTYQALLAQPTQCRIHEDVTALDLHPAQAAIRKAHGPDYHRSEQALWDVAALWGITPDHDRINDCGVFDPFDEVVDLRAGRCRADIKLAAAPSGLWAMSTSHSLSMSGASSAPSVWNGFAFESFEDARDTGLAEHRARFRSIAHSTHSDAADAHSILEQLHDAATPQLQLF